MEKNDTYKKQQRLAMIDLMVELPGVIAVAIAAISTSSLVMWMDFVDSFMCVFRAFVVVLISKKLSKNLKFKYNYGIGKIEAFTSIMCDVFLILSVVMLLIFSVIDICSPKQPSALLIGAIPLKILSVLADSWFCLKQRKIYMASKTKVTRSELFNTIKNEIFDSITLISVILIYIFRNVKAMWYFSPVICFIIGTYFIIAAVKNIKKSMSELLDETAEEEKQLKIIKVLGKMDERYKSLKAVNTRYNREALKIDLEIGFEEDVTYGEIYKFVCDIQEELHKVISDCSVNIVINNENT